MSDTKEVIAGAVAVALPLWVRAQDDTDRDLRNNRLDLRDLESEMRACCNHGAMIRSKLAIAQDVGVGIALSNPKTTVPEILPTSIPYTRAVIGEDTINDYKYPPRVGNYLPNGALTEAGEMTRLFLALAFQENRAWIEGFTLPGSPAPTVTAQIFSASRALSTVISGLTLSRNEWISAWKQLFEGGLQSIGTPSISNVNIANGVASVTPIGGATFTNRAMRIRVTASGVGINASTELATVTFSKPYPSVPAIVGSDGLVVTNVTTGSFSIQWGQAFGVGQVRDFAIVVGV